MRQDPLAGCLYGFNSAAERRTVIFMLWEELKKIITLKKILFLLGVIFLYYLLFLVPYVVNYEGSYRQEIEIARTMNEKYGPWISREDYELMKADVPFEGKEMLDQLIPQIPEFAQAGIRDIKGLVLDETLSTEEKTALWAALNDAISLKIYEEPELASQMITDGLELSYWSDYLETYREEVLDPPAEGTTYYTDLSEDQSRRVAERNRKERDAILPMQVLENHFEVLQFMAPLMIICNILLILPYMVRENNSRISGLLYTFPKGRRYFRVRFAAVFVSSLLLTLIFLAMLAGIGAINKIYDFWNIPVSAFTSGFISWFPWTLGQLTMAAAGLSAAASIGAGLCTFVLTARCGNYITAIAVQIPLILLGVLFGIFCTMRMTEITKNPFLSFGLAGGWLAVGLWGGLVMYGMEKRRDMPD